MAAKDIRQWAKAKFGIQERFSSLLEWFLKKKLRIALSVAAAAAAFFLFIMLKGILLAALFIIIGAASLLYNRFIRTSLGIELITLAVVMTGRLYGTGAAMFAGFLSLLLAELATESLQHKTIVSFIGILVIGFLTQFFAGTSIMMEGIILTIVYDAIILPGYLMLGSNPARCILFLVTHIAFNIWLFTAVAPFIAGIII